MDERELAAKLIGETVWPAFGLTVLLIFRKQMPRIMDRITKVSVPGGGGVELSPLAKAIEATQASVFRLEQENKLTTLAPPENIPAAAPEPNVISGLDNLEPASSQQVRSEIAPPPRTLRDVALVQIRKSLKDANWAIRNSVRELSRLADIEFNEVPSSAVMLRARGIISKSRFESLISFVTAYQTLLDDEEAGREISYNQYKQLLEVADLLIINGIGAVSYSEDGKKVE